MTTTVPMPTNFREFYSIINDNKTLPMFVREQKLVLESEDHQCPKCGSEMRDGKHQKTLKDEIIWLWCFNITSKTVPWTVGCSEATTVDWCNFLREVCTEKMNVAEQMGGIGEVVQIDESLFRGKHSPADMLTLW
ncbi:unnamed protein product [Didymodactylos carnosus]|uniref:Transposase n=1 Tax=Didymodactylos carnosus TaxID=1234261 RepID=A0A8S2IC15_9BILA|nr:unnamed protein product [Didymodactylos carnosus]CAF3725387.1 unnamed protein product [Didymodactylos carnosus]